MKVDGNNNLIKFFEYIMEFKLGNKDEYQNRKNKLREKPNKVCTDFYKSTQIDRRSMPLNL